MDKTAIKNFAVWARKKLIEDIKQKAYEIGITEKEIKEPEVSTSDTIIIGDRTLNKAEMQQRKSLVSRIREKGFNNVIEEVAYTWFNRFIALRFMEVNEYLPTGVRVLSSIEPGKKEPDIIKEALNIDLDIDRELVYRLQDGNDTETLYRYLLVKQCNALKEILPGLFEKIEDYTEILLPSNLLGEGSVIRRLVDDIPEEDFKDQVEIIGWMYQYYISEKHDEVVGINKGIIRKEDIPAATQLFTPEWIVKYMVDNSLGKLWILSHSNDDLKNNWKYYIDEAEQKPDIQKELDDIKVKWSNLKPEDIKVFDPCMGSGHILCYCFDVLYDIYKSTGYSEKDIPKLILENNLYGLDIDDRAYQLAYFSIMMKARSRNRRIFRDRISLNICSIQESNGFPKEAIDYFVNSKEIESERSMNREDIEYLIEIFYDAKEYGSILNVRNINLEAIEKRLEEIMKWETQNLFEYQYKNIILEKIPILIKQAKIISNKYDIVVTNPPYMNKFDNKLKKYIAEYYEDFKGDLFSVFIKRNIDYTKENGFTAFMTPFVWMFIKTYEGVRKYIINNICISSLIELEYSGFEEATVPVCTFVLFNKKINYNATYIKLSDFKGAKNQPIKVLEAIKNPGVYYRYNCLLYDLKSIEGYPIAYWASKNVKKIFENSKQLNKIADPKQGLATGDNNRFLKLWYEVDIEKVGFNSVDKYDVIKNNKKWVPCNKGGAFRKWYGNNYFLIYWENDGSEIKNFKGSVIRNERYYFREGATWSSLTSSDLSVRYSPKGFIFETKGSVCFPHDNKNLYYILGYLNSKLVNYLIKMISPNIDYHEGPMGKLPIIIENVDNVNHIVIENIRVCKTDWDSFETSWDFRSHPLLLAANEQLEVASNNNEDKNCPLPTIHFPLNNTIQQAFNNWSTFAEKQFNRLKANEEELNRIFIEIYGLQDELTPEVDDKDVTIRKADRVRDIKSFISYAVGCMFGRYSINAEGLIYAGGDFKDRWKCENGQWKVRKIVKDDEGKVIEDTWVDATFVPDTDNVLPITDDEYFEDDIVSRFIEFLKVTFGEDTLEENLDYIADTLGRKSSETARQAIRRYFLKDFYKDHVQVYQKKPIYWLFDSGKQDGFKALIYMHRYDEFTVARVRTDYLHKLQKSYEAEIKRLDIIIDSNVSQREKTNARKKKEKILKQMEECLQYDQVIAHVANQRIKIDLDDGVSVNYSKFQGIEVPQGEGRKPLKADLLAKI